MAIDAALPRSTPNSVLVATGPTGPVWSDEGRLSRFAGATIEAVERGGSLIAASCAQELVSRGAAAGTGRLVSIEPGA